VYSVCNALGITYVLCITYEIQMNFSKHTANKLSGKGLL